jgi:hypothetical protein
MVYHPYILHGIATAYKNKPIEISNVSKGQQMNILNIKKLNLHSKNLKSFSQIKGNSMHDCEFLRVHNFCYRQPFLLPVPGTSTPSYTID